MFTVIYPPFESPATRLSSIQKEVKDYFLSKEFNEKVKDLISKFLER